MKNVAAILGLIAVLAFSATAFAGNGGGINARLAKIDARVAKYHSKCDVNPKAKCPAAKARISARLTKLEGKLDARIAKVKKAERKAMLQAARDHIAGLLAAL